ncbi:hypothetical protein LCGC14_1546030, partial [marine sediment metagenome]
MPSTIDEDTVHFVGQASAFTPGANLVTNGTFDADTDWVKTVGTPSGWAIAAGVATCDGNQSVDTDLTQVIASGFTAGRLYRMQFEITVFTAGTVTARFDAVEIGDKAGVGVYTGYGVATGAGVSIDIRGDSNFIGTIDNVSVVPWVGDFDAGGGTTIAGFTGTLTDYMTATGGVLHNDSSLVLSNDGGNLAIAAATTWDTTPQVGTLVNCDFSAALTNIDDGIFEIITASSTSITIDGDSTGFSGKDVEVWIGGAYPDIATALNASTLAEDPDGTYRKRYICVNVDQE